MKKRLTYILLFLIAVAVITLFLTGNNKTNRDIDSRITLRKNDKKPYGMYVAFENLKQLFPSSSLSVNKYEPGYWDSLSTYDKDQALIIAADRFTADDAEMKKIIAFAENGNDVFITARVLSFDIKKVLNCKTKDYIAPIYYYNEEEFLYDSLTVSLSNPPFEKNLTYTYPGRGLSSSFEEVDTTVSDILGVDKEGNPDFIHLQAGKGNFYIHLAPIAFSNYFLLHKSNIRYYEKAFSLINPSVKRIVWDEYYLNNNVRNNKKEDEKGWFSVLLRYPALKAALLTAILALLVYVILEMRRKQRYIPVVIKPKNDSLDFVKTIGRLYFDKGNHRNLCRKMASYFLEHVRNKYKLATGNLDEEFINNLGFKAGAEESEIRGIVSFIKYLDDAPVISPADLTDFHTQLDSFYKKA